MFPRSEVESLSQNECVVYIDVASIFSSVCWESSISALFKFEERLTGVFLQYFVGMRESNSRVKALCFSFDTFHHSEENLVRDPWCLRSLCHTTSVLCVQVDA